MRRLPMARGAFTRALFVLTLLLSVAAHADVAQQGTTALRLDAVDVEGAAKGGFTFYASFLNRHYKPIPMTQAKDWAVTFDGEPVDGALEVKQLSESPQGVSLVIVLAAYQAVEGEPFELSRKGITRLLNRLRAQDNSSAIIYGSSVETSGSLNPAHNEAVGWLTERKVGGVTVQLFESVEKGLNLFPTGFDAISANRALLIVSDGYDETADDPARAKDRLQTIQREAKRRNVRIHVVGNAIEGDEELKQLKKLSSYTGGTYREATHGAKLALFIDHVAEELLGQHVITLTTTDFEEEKDTAFKLQVTQSGQDFTSNAVIRYVPEQESHLLKYLAIGGGAFLGLLIIFFIIRAIVRAARNREPEEVVDMGPETRFCGGCNNQVPIAWKVCQYCEALPHLGKLVVISSGALNGNTFFIRESLTNIGKAEGNTIVIDDPSVSKHHAGIKVKDQRFELADFGSTNGVTVNGQRISKLFLKDRDRVGIGGVELEFKLKK